MEIAKKESNAVDELKARRTLESLKESLKDLDGKEVVVTVGWNAEKKSLEDNLTREKEKLEEESTRRNYAVILCFLLTIVILLIIHTNKIRRKAKQEQYENNLLNLTLAKVQSENKLNATSKTISSYKNYLFEKNRFSTWYDSS